MDIDVSAIGRKKTTRRTVVAGAAASGFALAGARFSTARAQSSDTAIDFLNIWTTPTGQAAPATKHPVDQLIDAFNAKKTGITVTSRAAANYAEELTTVQTELAASKPPALAATPWASINFAYDGLGISSVEDIAKAAGGAVDDLLGNIKPDAIALASIDDKAIGVPFAFSCPVMYYNADFFDKAGVKPEDFFKDWASFTSVGATLKSANSGNPVLGYSRNVDWAAQSIIQSNGGHVLNDDGTWGIDSPEAIEALQTIATLDKGGILMPSFGTEVGDSFKAGAIPVMIGSIAALGGLNKAVTYKLATSTFPVFGDKPRKMAAGGSFIGCYARSDEQRKASWEFLKFVTSEEGAKIWGQTGYLNSTNFDLPILPNQQPAYTQLAEGLTRETPWPGSRSAEIQKIWGDQLERIYLNDISTEDGVKEIKPQMESLQQG